LIACVLIAASLFRLGILGMRFAGGALIGGGEVSRERTGPLALRFVHSLIPIAAAYAIAHYFSFLVYQGQSVAGLLSDPPGHGSNLLGTAHASVDYNLVSATGIWYVQVAALVLGTSPASSWPMTGRSPSTSGPATRCAPRAGCSR